MRTFVSAFMHSIDWIIQYLLQRQYLLKNKMDRTAFDLLEELHFYIQNIRHLKRSMCKYKLLF